MKKYFLALLLLFFPTASIAAGSPWYVGLGAGQSKADVDSVVPTLDVIVGVPGFCTLGGVSCSGSTDDTDTGIKIFGGYRLNPSLAIEASYIDFGTFTADALLTLGAEFISIDAKAEATAFAVAVVGFWPFTPTLSGYGKLGLARHDVDAKVTVSSNAIGILTGTVSDSETGTEPMFGLGLEYELTPQIAGRLEWEQYQDVGDDDTTGQSDVDWLGVSVLYSF